MDPKTHRDPRGIQAVSAESPLEEAGRVILERHSPAGAVVDGSLEVIEFRGRTGRFLEPQPGQPNVNLASMARPGLADPIRQAVEAARLKGAPARVEGVQVQTEHDSIAVNVEAIPLGRHFLVLFEEGRRETDVREIIRLRQELAATRRDLQTVIEQQAIQNEELKIVNEEMQCSNQELRAANDELEAAHEQLGATNEELQIRNLELQQLNDDFQNLLSSVQLPLVMVDRALRVRRFTPAASKLLNLISSDIGSPLRDLKPNLDQPDLSEVIGRVIDHLIPVEREVHDRDGRIYSMWARPYRATGNRIDGAVMAFADITALKQNAEESRVLREYAEAVAATVREPFLALDAALRVIAANPPFYSTFGLTPENTENAVIFELGDGQWNIPRLRTWLASEAGFREGLRIEHDFGAAGRKVLSVNLRKLAGAGVTLLAIQDISAQRAAETALREAQARFSAFSRAAPVGILYADSAGQCSSANPQACEIAGVTAEEALGQGWLRHLHAEDRPAFLSRIEQVSKHCEPFAMPLRFLRPSGIAWANSLVIPLAGGAYIAALADVTGRIALEERLAQTNKLEAIGRLAGGVAHDFNNMLTAISSYSAQLLEILPRDHTARHAAEQIAKGTDQAAAVTRQLLAFSRKQVLRAHSVDLNRTIRDTGELLARLLGGDIEISLDLDADAGMVLVDYGQLQQVILNLAINARDAMPRGGRLSLSTSRVSFDPQAAQRESLAPGDYVCLSVGDTGMGMDRETRERLFEPFYTTKAPGEGTGLGLATVYGIVQQSGGGIRVESELNAGSVLRIYLPRSTSPQPEPAAPVPATSGGRETVLLVEDTAMVRSLVRELLEQRGYTVLEAGDAHEAISLTESYRGEIHLLLTDLVMPRMGGHELARRIASRIPRLRVIYMSGFPGGALNAAQKSANFLEKPFKPEVLATLVRKVLDAPTEP